MASDRRAYIKVADSVADEPWSDSTLATVVRIWALLNTRWARHRLPAKEAGSAFLRAQDMMRVTNTDDPNVARDILMKLPNRVGDTSLNVSESQHAEISGVQLEWPSFPEFQGYPAGDGPKRVRPKRTPNSPRKPGRSRGDPPPSASASADASASSSPVRRRGRPPAQWAFWIAGLLGAELRKRQPGARVPKDFDAWARQIAAIDAEPGTIAAAVRWLYSEANEGEYRIEVQSGASLREKFGRVQAQIERRSRAKGEAHKQSKPFVGSIPSSGVDEAAEQVRREIAEHEQHALAPDPSCARCKFDAAASSAGRMN